MKRGRQARSQELLVEEDDQHQVHGKAQGQEDTGQRHPSTTFPLGWRFQERRGGVHLAGGGMGRGVLLGCVIAGDTTSLGLKFHGVLCKLGQELVGEEAAVGVTHVLEAGPGRRPVQREAELLAL